MAKKTQANDTDYNMEEESMEDAVADFNLDDDYKPDPLLRNGTYKGNVSEVTRSGSKVTWKVVLDDNGGFMSDGETEVDGSAFVYNNWLPRDADREERTASGKNKWQTKVNMLKRFADDMQVNMSTMSAIDQAIEEMSWVGLPVFVEMKNETYMGTTSSRINSMKRRPE